MLWFAWGRKRTSLWNFKSSGLTWVVGIELRWSGLYSKCFISWAILLALGFFFLIVWHVLLKAEESVPFPGAGVTGHCEMPTLVLGTELGSCGRTGNTVNPWVNFPAHTDNVNDLCCLWESLGLTLYGKYFLNRTRSYKVWPHHPSKKALENAPHQDLRKKHP